MQKKTLLALLLALSLLLSGCALVTVDSAKDNAQVIIDVNGETLNKALISYAVENQVSTYEYYNQLYSAYGISFSTDEDEIAADVIDSYVSTLVSKQKAYELGLNELTEEERAEVEETAQSNYDTFIESVASTYMPGSALEGDELTAAAIQYVESHGLTTVDGRSTLADFIQSATDDKAIEKLDEYMIKDVEVTEEEFQTEFARLAEEAKAEYETDPNAYGDAVNGGSAVYYAPAGYRMVKHILVKMSDEDTAVTDEKDAAVTEAETALSDAQYALDNAAEDADKDALQAAVTEAQDAVVAAMQAYDEAQAAALAKVKAAADEIYAQATAEGADFDALIAENNNDPGMPSTGYAIREGFTSFVESFTAAGMALENVGDVSEPVESSYGYHIIKYVADVAEGPVDAETVRESITSSLLSTKQETVRTETLNQYIAEAKIKTYPERLK